MSTNIAARAAIVRNAGAPWVIEDVEISPPREDEILVRMVGAGICHSDLACREGRFPVPMPIVLGHEGAGVVEAVGSNVTGIKLGDHVVLSFDSCGHCPSCRKSRPSYCFDFYPRNTSGRRQSDGSSPVTQNGEPVNAAFCYQSSFCTYAITNQVNSVVIDSSLPLEIMGPLGCGILTGAGAAVNSVGLSEGDSFAIFGGGAVGLSALLGARVAKAGPVVVVEPNAQRRKLALELGATHVVDPVNTPDVLACLKDLMQGGVSAALDTTGIPSVIAAGVEALLPNGTIGLLGIPSPEAKLTTSMISMMARGVGVKYVLLGDADPQRFIPRMASWYQEGIFPFDRLVKRFPFSKINEAAHASLSGQVVKPVLVF